MAGGSSSVDGCFKFTGVFQGTTARKETSKEKSTERSTRWNGWELCNAGSTERHSAESAASVGRGLATGQFCLSVLGHGGSGFCHAARLASFRSL